MQHPPKSGFATARDQCARASRAEILRAGGFFDREPLFPGRSGWSPWRDGPAACL